MIICIYLHILKQNNRNRRLCFGRRLSYRHTFYFKNITCELVCFYLRYFHSQECLILLLFIYLIECYKSINVQTPCSCFPEHHKSSVHNDIFQTPNLYSQVDSILYYTLKFESIHTHTYTHTHTMAVLKNYF